MGVNRGKQFEDAIKDAFEAVPGVSIDRFQDPMAGFAGISNICDFVVYQYPTQNYFECKSCYGNTLSIHSNDPKNKYGAITNTQWEGLLEKSPIPGVKAGILVWFIDHDITAFVDIRTLVELKNSGAKSLHVKHLWEKRIPYVLVPGRKKRVLFEYDAHSFLIGLYYFDL